MAVLAYTKYVREFSKIMEYSGLFEPVIKTLISYVEKNDPVISEIMKNSFKTIKRLIGYSSKEDDNLLFEIYTQLITNLDVNIFFMT